MSFDRLRLVCVLFLMCLLSSSCGKNDASESVRVAYLPILASSILFVALDQGYFEEEGVKVEPIRVGSANQAMDSVIAGRADAAIMLGFTTLITVAEKRPDLFKITQAAYETEDKYTANILVKKNSELKTIADLKGLKVGTYTGLTQRMNLELVLEKFLAKGDVEIVQVEQNLQIPGLEHGQYDALFTIDPYSTTALVLGTARSLEDNPRFKHILQPFPTAANILSTTFIEANPKLTKSFNAAMERALKWVEQNPKEANLIAAKKGYADMSPEVASQAGLYELSGIGEQDESSAQKLVQLMRDHQLLSGDVSMEKLFFGR